MYIGARLTNAYEPYCGFLISDPWLRFLPRSPSAQLCWLVASWLLPWINGFDFICNYFIRLSFLEAVTPQLWCLHSPHFSFFFKSSWGATFFSCCWLVFFFSHVILFKGQMSNETFNFSTKKQMIFITQEEFLKWKAFKSPPEPLRAFMSL